MAIQLKLQVLTNAAGVFNGIAKSRLSNLKSFLRYAVTKPCGFGLSLSA
ncbi:MAG: hypothetical protein IKZ88_10300 [Neisseriaceae bacterium]|nr:hypothetical protein [Neisseriaceae bacterium]